MADEELRRAEREAATGDVEERSALIAQLLRSGAVTREAIELAAFLRDPAALAFVGAGAPQPSEAVLTGQDASMLAGLPITELDLGPWRDWDDLGDGLLRSLPTLPSLTSLRVPAFDIEPSALAALTRQPELRALDLDTRYLGDEYLVEVAALNGLEELVTGGAEYMTNEGLAVLGSLTALQKLALDLSYLDPPDAALAFLSELRDLRVLDIGPCNGLTGAFLEHVPTECLEELSLVTCPQLTGEGLHRLADAPLTGLTLFDAPAFTDAGLVPVGGFDVLEKLVLYGASCLTDDGIRHLGRLESIEDLALLNCRAVQGDGLAALADAPALTDLDLSSTPITTSGWAAVARLRLTDLTAQAIPLSDTAFETIGGLSGLVTLNLTDARNTSDGGLQPLSKLTELQELYLGGVKGLKQPDLLPLLDLPALEILEVSRGLLHPNTVAKRRPELELRLR